jgi:chemotaxis protein methyltransferase CheR
MAPDDFDTIARLLRRRSGLVLTHDRSELAARALKPVMQRYGFRDIGALVADIRMGHDALAEAVAEALTVNETCFFREPAQFARLQNEILPRLVRARAGSRRLRLWSAACSNGQEAWSLAMLLDEIAPQAGLSDGWQIDLVGTDFSGLAVARAEAGCYSGFEMDRGIDAGRRARHFDSVDGAWTISEPLRAIARFRRFNLLDSCGWIEDVDILLCRNVLMYFDAPTRTQVLERLTETLSADGVLLLGESETVELMPQGLKPVPGTAGIWQRHESAARKAG